ncbi:hypothetical protein MANES_03G055816v8 [Manihot esculenta]|uniref:Reverse transcriptase zinc-binding domain-containing protein n=1 Tax=Manihot esculenta TaxID=3983 RepID=A0A2C9W4V8_MANES|nr:hypothetical protein MANES_03G055816v8 [Manihot esculenta]
MKNVIVDSVCVICGEAEETADQIFMHCLHIQCLCTRVRVGEDGNSFLPMCIRLTLRRDSLLLVSPLLVVLFEIGRVIYCWRRQSMFHLTGILLWQRFMLSNKELNLLLQGYRSVLME